MDPDTLVQEKLDADIGFTDSIAALSDDEKAQAIADKRSEITKQVIVELADKAKKNEDLAGNYKTRAEKAEALVKPKPAELPAPKEEVLSEKDRMALYKSDVHVDDLEEVLKAARYFGGGDVAKGLQNDAVKNIITTNAEHRKTAEASNTRAARPTQKEPTDEQVQEDLSKGEVPDKGSKKAEQLFWARRGGKK